LLSRLLPDAVAVVESFGDLPDAELYPAEAALIRDAVAKRRDEFTTVRHCARRALSGLGLAPVPVLPDRYGAPQWPDGVVGSLTHCDGYRAAALTHAGELMMLGIDAEPHAPLPDGVLGAIALPAEQAWIRSAPPHVHWGRLLFSAKESVYKAWYPYTGARLGFEDAELRFEPSGTFTALLTTAVAPSLPDRLSGRWLIGQGLIVTTVAVPPGPDRP
jgi:4'-phosphopantetheinyl transferase EntD